MMAAMSASALGSATAVAGGQHKQPRMLRSSGVAGPGIVGLGARVGSGARGGRASGSAVAVRRRVPVMTAGMSTRGAGAGAGATWSGAGSDGRRAGGDSLGAVRTQRCPVPTGALHAAVLAFGVRGGGGPGSGLESPRSATATRATNAPEVGACTRPLSKST
jgi:hypothetical protein